MRKHLKRFSSCLVGLFAGLPIALGPSPLVAGPIESFWIEPAGGVFHDPANWDGPVPDETVTAIFDLNSSYSVMFDAEAVSDRLLLRDGQVTILLNNYLYSVQNPLNSTPSIVIGDGPASSAELTITGGTLEAMFTDLGQAASSYGFLQISGPGATLANESHLRVGHEGTGFLTVSGAATVFDHLGVIGLENNALGLATVTGEGSLWSNVATLTIGQQGVGFLFILGEGTVSCGSGIIGQQLDSIGEVTVNGTGSRWLIDGPLDVGQTGFGSLAIFHGGMVSNSAFATIGTFPGPGFPPEPGGMGEVVVTGAGSNWTIDGDLHVGFMEVGSLTVSDGGSVFSGNGFINTVGGFASSGSVVIVSGLDSLWSNLGDLVVADPLQVLDEGLVTAQLIEIISEGELVGDGTVQGVVMNSAAVRPGRLNSDPIGPFTDPLLGVLTVEGSFTQDTDGTLFIEVDRQDFTWVSDVLEVTGEATLRGTLDVFAFGPSLPNFATTFDILTAASIRGEFDLLIAPPLCCDQQWSIIYQEDVVQLGIIILIPGDLDGDGSVGIIDLLTLLAAWGPCPDPPDPCPADLDDDGTVGILDLLTLLANWG